MTTVAPIRLFKRLWLALSSPKDYAQLYHQTTGRTLITLLLFCLLTALASGVSAALWINHHMPDAQNFTADLKIDLQNLYPADLKVTITNGKLSLNQPAPYTIALPERWSRFLAESDEELSGLPYLVTIAPQARVEDYEQYKSIVLLTETTAVYPSRSNQYTASDGSSYSRIQTSFARYDKQPETANLAMDQAKYLEMYRAVEPYLNKIPAVVSFATVGMVLLFPWLVGLFSWIGAFVYLLFGTLVVWIISAVMKRPFAYGQLYALGLYGIMTPTLIQTILSMFGVHLPPFGFTLLFAVWMGVILHHTPTLGSVVMPTPSPSAPIRA